MLPSSTVENYLKALFKAQAALDDPKALVPMGQLASALGVVPGTATTMVKALTESGLVTYEPYVGVRLTPAGERLAALVLRRHRLIELFLVRVMGMSWAEVHDEAEQLEHAVSDRLIERIDEILGRPATDPHGDPIPDADGTIERPKYDTLLTCPLHRPVVVARIVDQDADFLRFLEHSDLTPGQSIEVEARDEAADSVRLRGKENRRLTIGMRAASKLLVDVVGVLLLSVALGGAAAAQESSPAPPEPFQILDNSFLVEEAFNQEAGVFQNILGFVRFDEGWELAYTQEWPVQTIRHQLSYTLPFVGVGGASGVGDVLINYRYQLLAEGPGRPAVAPRLSLILPSGSTDKGLGDGSVGWQVNLPFSKQTGDVYWHWNGGFTYLPGAEIAAELPGRPGREVGLTSFHLAGSAIWRTAPMLHLMLETVAAFDETPGEAAATSRETTMTIAPGMRGGWNIGDQQVITGLAVPFAFTADRTDVGVLLYFSYELPFRK